MQKTWWILLLALVVVGCASSPLLEGIKIYRREWYEKHDPEVLMKWRELAEKEVTQRPQSAMGWFYFGEAYINLGEQKSNVDTMIKGAKLVNKAFQTDSIKVLKHLRQHGEAYWSIFRRFTNQMIEREDYRMAKAFLHIAFKIIPDRAENYTMQGLIALEDGDTSQAVLSYQKAIELNPQDPYPYGYLGRIYSLRGETDSAFRYYAITDSLMEARVDSMVTMIVPDRPLEETRDPVVKASILVEEKRDEEAKKLLKPFGIENLKARKKLLKRLTDIRYDLANLIFQMGVDEFKQKNYQEALTRFEKVVKIQPKHQGAWFQGGICKYQLKDYSGAEANFRYLTILRDDDFRYWFYLGASIAQQERYRDAIEPFERAAELNPKNPDTYRNLALIYSKIGEKKKAVEYYKKAQEVEKGGK
ncbi:hypothetical protein DRP53_00320 [candidate division WOR-3 bacterium]|uniref:Tetratricopeptide repeat protein n=1 Tax=candidate division WOR-3 bacterium TaxID=2052148 RepID=A0A660SLP1_UNCW3|nr:MAG: hypothetical protein DRP53_00320 [candidate division WOR-3 bacterium]